VDPQFLSLTPGALSAQIPHPSSEQSERRRLRNAGDWSGAVAAGRSRSFSRSRIGRCRNASTLYNAASSVEQGARQGGLGGRVSYT